jgi:hypothetical protein
MKKIVRVLMLLAVTSLFAVANSNAQVIVHVRPVPPRGAVVVRGVAPSPRHIWVGEEWAPRGRAYVYRPGHWEVPPRRGGVWVGGHWVDRPGGSVWISGYWR